MMLRFFALIPAMLLLPGCSSLFPSSQATTKSQWQTFSQAEAAFDKIVPFQTTTNDLKTLGFDAFASPNIKVLTYLDVIQRFMPNQSITKEDLDKAVRDCLESKEACHACEIELREVKSKRFGNLLLDIFGFKKNTHETGWSFKAIILYRGDLVVYKLASGEPAIDRIDKKLKPLGPLQELDNFLSWGMGTVR